MKPKFFLLHASNPLMQPVEKLMKINPLRTQYKPHKVSAMQGLHAVNISGRKAKYKTPTRITRLPLMTLTTDMTFGWTTWLN
tara:strand:+ start:241 stop:486 length:246 start_codon:yes stop_codon:yes gene_type:complete